MPTFNTPTYLLQIGSGASPLLPQANFANAKLRYATIRYALAGTEATADILNLVRLKPGVVILPQLSKITCEDPGTALTLDIGFASNPDALCDGAALTTAHDVFFTGAPSVTAVDQQYNPVALAAGDELIYATLVLVDTPTAGAEIVITLAYLDE